MKNKLVWLLGLSVVLTACDVDNELNPIVEETVEVAATAGTADFSNYVAIGASFTAGFSDGALFEAAQTHSFPNILAQKFMMTNGGDFTQPLMNDNIGGMMMGGQQIPNLLPRLYFDGAGPSRLDATSTTDVTTVLAGPFNNMGVPGAKSFHIPAVGYGTANPYFGRMASSAGASVLQDAVAQNPTFFTISEIGGNDVLGYAMSGGTGVDRTGDTNAAAYGGEDITDPGVFTQSLTAMVTALSANGAKGAIATVPGITSLPFFTTVPHDALDADTNAEYAAQIPTLNSLFGALNGVFAFLQVPERSITFSAAGTSAVVIKDETLPNLSAEIAGVLSSDPTFPTFLAGFGLGPDMVPAVAQLLGMHYGQARQATEDDLLVLTSSGVIGTTNMDSVQDLMNMGLSQTLAGLFSAEGLTLPMADQWALIPSEIQAVQTATDAYNASIRSIASSNGLALVDLTNVLSSAADTGYAFDEYVMTTDLVMGGLVSLDGIHLTSRGYALMAAEFLKAIDTTFGSNYSEATNGMPVAGDYPTNYGETFR